MSKERGLQMLFSRYDRLAARIDQILLKEDISAEDQAEVDQLDDQLDALTEQIVDLEDAQPASEVGQWWVIPIKRWTS